MSNNDKSNVVDEFYKTSAEDEKYIVSINHFQGNLYLDIRLFYKPDDKDDFLPTRKGISLSVEHIDKIIGALEKAKTRIGGEGNLREMQSQ